MQPKLKALLANQRFVAIVGMLGSNGHGEAANAAAMATKMLKEAGLTWGELLSGAGGPMTAQQPDERALRDLRRVNRALADANAAHEVTLQKWSKDKQALSRARRDLDAKDDMIKSLEAALRKANEQRPKEAPKQQGGFRFTDVPPPEEPAIFAPVTYREVKGWLDKLVKEAWDDLSEWEVNFFTDFIEQKKGVVSERQHAIFKRVATKVGIPLDF